MYTACTLCVCVCVCVTFLVHYNNVASYFNNCGTINCSSGILLVCHIGAFLNGGPALVPHGVPWVDRSRSNQPSDMEQEWLRKS